ncbi:MAG TPA: aminofutalosine synthase MqnE [Bacteroidales bacterium]|nr:aminofutalosine synthase MqnE [Bacteroidales bacterium]
MDSLLNSIHDNDLKSIALKVINKTRISQEEGVLLYKSPLAWLGMLASHVRRSFNGDYAYFNHNFHIEPTNKCVYNCRFCSYHKNEGDPDSWEYSHDEMLNIVKTFDCKNVTEVHIVGGVHPSYDLHYWANLIKKIKDYRPDLHIKAFSAIEIDFMFKKTNVTDEEGFRILKASGLDSIPGGGAEIFNEELRNTICPEKASSERWLQIHESAHRSGIPSNATMLYGHLEKYENRIDHLNRLRDLQDKTGGFNAFIPLKFKKANNSLSFLGEVSLIEDLKNYAVSRIFLDNFPHIKAYWPMIGKEGASLALSFGADDVDGTIDDTTRIYTMAGSEDKPAISTSEICGLIRNSGCVPVERDSYYNTIKVW